MLNMLQKIWLQGMTILPSPSLRVQTDIVFEAISKNRKRKQETVQKESSIWKDYEGAEPAWTRTWAHPQFCQTCTHPESSAPPLKTQFTPGRNRQTIPSFRNVAPKVSPLMINTGAWRQIVSESLCCTYSHGNSCYLPDSTRILRLQPTVGYTCMPIVMNYNSHTKPGLY